MSVWKGIIPEMSDGEALTLDKINEIIGKSNDRRIVAQVQALPQGGLTEYHTNDANSVIRIEARSVVAITAGAGAYSIATIPFSGTYFTQAPLVVATWGDITDSINTRGEINAPVVLRKTITNAAFQVYGAVQPNSRVRVNYIAIGPT